MDIRMLKFWNKFARYCVYGLFINFSIFLVDFFIQAKNGTGSLGWGAPYRPIYTGIMAILFILAIIAITESEKYWRRINKL